MSGKNGLRPGIYLGNAEIALIRIVIPRGSDDKDRCVMLIFGSKSGHDLWYHTPLG